MQDEPKEPGTSPINANPHGAKKAAKKLKKFEAERSAELAERETDEKFMRLAIRRAKLAEKRDEVPVGAVVVKDGKAVAFGYNLRESKQDATLHAELIAIRRSCRALGTFRLEGCTLYVTLEPCAMCSGAVVNSRISRVVFGASDPKGGCCGSLYSIPEDCRFNHRARVTGGVLGEECASLLTAYFQAKRKK